MSGYFANIINGLKSLAIGLQITNREFLKKPVTLQYPHEALKMTPRYRGHIELQRHVDTGTHSCIACGMCANVCPSNCITINSKKVPGVKGKVLTSYMLNFTTCSLCGQCVENCSSNSLNFSNEYNLASTNKDAYIMDLLKRLHPEGVPEPVVDPELLKKEEEKKAEAAKKAAEKKAADAAKKAAQEAPAEKSGEATVEEKS
jgi:NADH-quinone oxidoreductase subunit I